MNNYERGSEWRRWDLHLHTKGTLKCDNFTSSDFDEFCKVLFRKALNADIAVIGVTDYFSIDNYKKVVDFVQHIGMSSGFTDEEQQRIKTIYILPNVELRMLPVTDNGKLVNIHCIFDPNYVDSLENDFFSSLKHSAGPGNNYLMNRAGMIGLGKSIDNNLDDNNAFKKGINSFVVSHERLQELYEQNRNFRENVIIAVSNNSNDGASGLQKHYDLFENVEPGSLDGLRRAIYKLADIVFSGNEKDRTYFLGKSIDSQETVISKCGSIKACIHGSDAHTEDKLFIPANNKFCWIKADPTFEGLKQVIFEPEDRVRIQEANPAFDFLKPYFNSITVTGQAVSGGTPSFKNTTLALNPGLIALIGGRGTGKSILLDCIYKLFNDDVGNDDRLEEIAPGNMELVFSKSDRSEIEYSYDNRSEAKLDYLHVRQGEIKEIAKKPEALSEAIKRLLGIDVTSRAPDYDQEFSAIINRIDKTLAWFELKNEENLLINDRQYNEDIIKSNQSLISTITTEQNKENIERYQKNQQEINSRNSAISRLTDFKTSLASHKLELNREIEEVNKLKIDIERLPVVNFNDIDLLVDKNIEKLKKDVLSYTLVNGEIEDVFRQQGIKQDISGLLQKIAQYQLEIDDASKKIEEYDDKLSSIETDINHRIQLVDKIETHLSSELNSINTAFNTLFVGKESWTDEQKSIVEKLLSNISIKGEIHFNIEEFYRGLSEILNGSKFRATGTESQEQRIRSKFNINCYDDYLRLLRNEKIIANGDAYISINEFYNQKEYFLKSTYNIFQYLYLYPYRKNYLNTRPVITYLGKAPSKLSVGQRGTFYVCMKLATDPYGSPFIFDQPEDDLDNDFIMRELVPIFRLIKNYRQVIIATHNANLVVNADAEQIIIANNQDEVLYYNSGSIENTSSIEPLGIRERVCNILEGGDKAFKQREIRYAIKQ